jgi:hypothetical protein
MNAWQLPNPHHTAAPTAEQGTGGDLVDQMMARYVAWREDAAAARDEYNRWCSAPADQEKWLFAVYRTALNREEASAGRYSRLVAEVERSIRADRMPPAMHCGNS